MLNVVPCLQTVSRVAFWGGAAALNTIMFPVTCFSFLGYANKLTTFFIKSVSASENARSYRNGNSYLQLARSYIPVDARIELAWASIALGCLSSAIKGEVMPSGESLIFGISIFQTLTSLVVPPPYKFPRSLTTSLPGEPTAPEKGG